MDVNITPSTQVSSHFDRTVLIAVDGSNCSTSALEWYATHGYRDGDKVIIAYCEEDVALPPAGLMAGNQAAIRAFIRENEQFAKAEMKKIEDSLSKYQFPHVMEKLHGSPGDAIVKAAEKQNADFIVMGSRGQGTIRRTIMGSVSDYVVHHSRIPVIICKHR